ncbi:hypothetical protein [Pseudoteredinibacter isoporae]|uniref:Uncharacterized protein n=1 Tax=Pseudoteredinibacter isoporae TaxID=570281 RepID=A0A7X0MW60_9GAMM|nr:hypothetical protein [Pseudoteredinibacter isoporae]MBB6521850.1 hypothetical protein [Pseudoteredinibacter isoporae]NHO87394.1 hypothetical protein [Pseudoteredinibacter isoporae]NIB22509.1 hypothetical protein [Pseudoteredinibacter isoporae]
MKELDLINKSEDGEFIGFYEMLLLPKDEIPVNRVADLLDLVELGSTPEIKVYALCLLVSWGNESAFDRLAKECSSGEGLLELDKSSHRLRGYSTVYEKVLEAFICYWINQVEVSEILGDGARKKIFQPLSDIIEKSNRNPFELKKLYSHILDYNWLEFAPLVKKHLEEVLSDDSGNQWKVVDAINFLDQYDVEFVSMALLKKQKSRKDFQLDRCLENASRTRRVMRHLDLKWRSFYKKF